MMMRGRKGEEAYKKNRIRGKRRKRGRGRRGMVERVRKEGKMLIRC